MVTYCVAKMKPIKGQLFETAIVASINKVLQTVFSHLKKQENQETVLLWQPAGCESSDQ